MQETGLSTEEQFGDIQSSIAFHTLKSLQFN